MTELVAREDLSPSEASDLTRLEETIRAGLETFVEVGRALMEIRKRRLYRAEFSTFEAYCQERWGWTDRRARQLMSASETVGNLENRNHGSGPAPSSERQVRPLTKLKEPEEQRSAWDEALTSAKDRERGPTASDVKNVVEKRMLNRAARKLPEPERAVALKVVSQPGLNPNSAHEALDNLSEMSPEDREEIYRLGTSRDERDRSLALTRALGQPPMPDPRAGMLKDAAGLVKRAANAYPDRPERVAALEETAARIMTIRAEIMEE